MCQQRVALRGEQRRLGARFFGGGDIAEQLRIVASCEAGERLAGGDLLRRERLLINGGLENDGCLLEKNLR